MWKWTKRISFSILTLIAFLLLSGITYQWISTKIDERKYPALGRLIDVGGYKLHANIQGSNLTGPVVVFESGWGCNSLEWTLVQSEVSKFVKTISYDRAGQGWSEDSPLERTSENIVDELHSLLQAEGESGPYILVGHSFGGINARLYASRYPDEVIGLVLVDSAHEDQMEKFPPMPKINTNLALFMTYVGAMRLSTYSGAYKELFQGIPLQVQSMIRARSSTGSSVRSVLKEGVVLEKSHNQLKIAGGNLVDKPLVVITAGKPLGEQAIGLSQEMADQMSAAWIELQKDLVLKSTKGEQIIAGESGHMIPHEQPEIIVEAIRKMVAQLNE